MSIKGSLYLKLILIFISIVAFSTASIIKDEADHYDENESPLEKQHKYLTLLDIISNINEDTIKITFEDPIVHKEWKLRKQKEIIVKETPEKMCAEALNKMTANLSSSYPYLDMRKYSAGDLADMGDKESCTNMQGVARYYVFVIGLKQLPLELRFGMCLPYECSPDIMNNAMSKITTTVNDVLGPLLEHPPVPLPTDVVPVMKLYMVSPDQWSEDSKDSRAAYSKVFGIFAAGLIGLVVCSTIYENIIKSQQRQELPKPQEKYGKDQKSTTGLSDKRTLATTKVNPSNENSTENPLYGNINYSEGLSNSIFSNEEVPKKFVDQFEQFHKKPLLNAIVSSFSLQVNLNKLTVSRLVQEDSEELEAMEGIRVLTMFWGIFCATSLYVLTAHVDNILRMLYLFKSISFTMCASGNLAPNLFIFFISFLGFYKINMLWNKLGKLNVLTYFQLWFYRILKYTPVFWFVFFFGWIALPYLSDSPTWYLSQTLFADCDKYWWSTMLYLNNLYPWFVEGLNGCFYWPFIVIIDVQLYLLLPVWVMVYRFNKIAFHVLMALMLIGGSILLFFIFYENKLSVGALTLENYYLYAYNFNKPYTKFPSVALGCWFGSFYLRLLEYRKIEADYERKENSKFLHFLHTSKLAVILLGVWSAGALNFTTLVPFEVNKDGYAWTTLQNSIYNALCQFGYVSSVMALLALLFCGRLHFLKNMLSSPIWRPLSKLTLAVYLLYPIVIMRVYVGLNESVYLGIINIAYLFFYNLVMTYLAALAVYLIIQGPMQNIMNIVITKIRNYESISFFDFQILQQKVKEN